MYSRSRRNKLQKRKRNKKLIRVFSVLAIVLFLGVLGTWIFGGEDKENKAKEETKENDTVSSQPEESSDEVVIVEEDSEKEDNMEATQEEETEEVSQDTGSSLQKERVESTDPLVVEAYVANWQPVGTEQAGPHTIDYDDGSQDRIEMRKAIIAATNLPEDNLIEWWIGRDGDQAVVATVSDKEETEIYRVYLSWIDGEGWQPTKVERLRENDKK
ncbi:MAG TPA: YrrS family protein [Bacillota bacterium]|nr:YrrS family protein [Bacillota bacterium]